jgi:hypothetical protein
VASLLLAAVVVSEMAVGLAASADLATTEIALRRPGFEESNPFMQTEPALRILSKAVVTTAVVVGSRQLRKKGKKNAAKVLCWTAAGIWAGAAVWNYRQYQQRRVGH